MDLLELCSKYKNEKVLGVREDYAKVYLWRKSAQYIGVGLEKVNILPLHNYIYERNDSSTSIPTGTHEYTPFSLTFNLPAGAGLTYAHNLLLNFNL